MSEQQYQLDLAQERAATESFDAALDALVAVCVEHPTFLGLGHDWENVAGNVMLGLRPRLIAAGYNK